MATKIICLVLAASLFASCSQAPCEPFDYAGLDIDTTSYQKDRLFANGSDTVLVEYNNFERYSMEQTAGGFAAKGECKNGFGTEIVCGAMGSAFRMYFLRNKEGYFWTIDAPQFLPQKKLPFNSKADIDVKLLSDPAYAKKVE